MSTYHPRDQLVATIHITGGQDIEVRRDRDHELTVDNRGRFVTLTDGRPYESDNLGEALAVALSNAGWGQATITFPTYEED